MDPTNLLIISLLLCLMLLIMRKKRNSKRRRRYAVRPINRRRYEKGVFNNFVKAVINHDHEYFFKYTRMMPEQFFNLHKIIEPYLRKKNTTKATSAITPMHRLVVTLHYLSEGCSMQEIAFNHYIGITTASLIIKETTEVIWNTLKKQYLKTPDRKTWESIESDFFSQWNVPNCIGAVDGKHVAIQCPKHTNSMYFNYKKHYSIVLMALCDANYKFTLVDVGAAGSNHDGAIFQNSSFGQAFFKNKLDIPPPKPLPGTNVTLPHFIVADGAFPLHRNIMRPFPGNYLDINKNVFNYRISRARRVIENTFGILTQRWRIYRRTIHADINTCENIILATIVLHNYLQTRERELPQNQKKYCPAGLIDTETEGNVNNGRWREMGSNLVSVRKVGSNNYASTIKENRDSLMNYFMSPVGEVKWQWDYVNRGSVPSSFTMEF